MEVKSYFSTTVEAAMELARREMGSEAMLITSRRTGAEAAHLGRYEVVFAREQSVEAEPARVEPERARVEPERSRVEQRRAVLETRRASQPAAPAPPARAETKPSMPAARAAAPAAKSAPPAVTVKPVRFEPAAALEREVAAAAATDFASLLEAEGVSRNESRRFFEGTLPRPRASAPQARSVPEMIERISRNVTCEPGLGHPGELSRTVALVGSPGAGKTTTLVKLAVVEGLMTGTPVRFLSLDAVRIAAADQLRLYAEILGVGFQSFETFFELSHVLRERPFGGLTLIDTPGFARNDRTGIEDLAACFQALPEVETQLVLRADRKTADNLRAMERYEIFRPSRLIVTALDETSDLAELGPLLASQALPVSYLGTGQRVPEDLEPASPERLAELIVCGWPEAALVAA